MEKLGHMTGVAVGLMVGMIIVVFALKLIHKDGKMKTRYDEMQKINRGKAYAISFWTLLGLEAVLALVDTLDIKLPFETPITHFLVIIIGVVVQVTYCIWKDAYVGLNDNMQRFAIFAVIISIFNFSFAINEFFAGELIVDGVFKAGLLNLVSGLIFIIIGIELFIKMLIDNNREE